MIDRDGSGAIAANELANVAVGGTVLGIDNGIKLIRVFDADGNGSIGAAISPFLPSPSVPSLRSISSSSSGRLQRVRLASQVFAQHAANLQNGSTIFFPTSTIAIAELRRPVPARQGRQRKARRGGDPPSYHGERIQHALLDFPCSVHQIQQARQTDTDMTCF